jgi:hypothetical protein
MDAITGKLVGLRHILDTFNFVTMAGLPVDAERPPTFVPRADLCYSWAGYWLVRCDIDLIFIKGPVLNNFCF